MWFGYFFMFLSIGGDLKDMKLLGILYLTVILITRRYQKFQFKIQTVSIKLYSFYSKSPFHLFILQFLIIIPLRFGALPLVLSDDINLIRDTVNQATLVNPIVDTDTDINTQNNNEREDDTNSPKITEEYGEYKEDLSPILRHDILGTSYEDLGMTNDEFNEYARNLPEYLTTIDPILPQRSKFLRKSQDYRCAFRNDVKNEYKVYGFGHRHDNDIKGYFRSQNKNILKIFCVDEYFKKEPYRKWEREREAYRGAYNCAKREYDLEVGYLKAKNQYPMIKNK
uniref:hypothetical protein n=1 Tax=Pascua guehoae TaxID=105714 RepID=UPI00226C9E6B|nr:hypothetical protein OYX24_mgp08 [Pascua guehoae]UZC57709.1 hypothetical protein [Pascua guehoae]